MAILILAILCATRGELNFKLQWKWAAVVAMTWFKSSYCQVHGLRGMVQLPP